MICPFCGKDEIKLELPITLSFDTDKVGAPDSVAQRLISISNWDPEGDSRWYCSNCYKSGKAKPVDNDWMQGAILLDRYERSL